MHCKEGAAILLAENIYEFLTNRSVQKPTPNYETDFTDWPYQQQLPIYARATAVQAIRNNLKGSEFHTDPNNHLLQQKVNKHKY